MGKIYLTSLQLREVGKMMEFSQEQIEHLANVISLTIESKGVKLINMDYIIAKTKKVEAI